MPLRRRAPLAGRRLLTVGGLAGFVVFFILVLDGAEVVRSALAGVAMAVWIIAMFAGLNWYNRFRAEAIANVVRDAAAQETEGVDSESDSYPEPGSGSGAADDSAAPNSRRN